MQQEIKPEIKIEKIQLVTLNGVKTKLFEAFRLIDDRYVFVGKFSAPAKTANKDLAKFID